LTKRVCDKKNSGQSLIVTALAVSLLIIAIAYSVFEANTQNQARDAITLNSHISEVKLGLQNTVTSALVNVSNGGTNQALTTNLQKYITFLGNQSFFGKCVTLFNVKNASPYQSGIKLSWGSNGTGVSSAYANSTLYFVETGAELQLEMETNISTTLNLEGSFINLGGLNKQVNVTCKLFNENEPALSKNITIYYEYDGEPSDQNWIAVYSSTVVDFGNGTYTISFVASTQTIDDPVLVSAQVYDTRNIFVLANVTCTET
jgi:hypothetical protein